MSDKLVQGLAQGMTYQRKDLLGPHTHTHTHKHTYTERERERERERDREREREREREHSRKHAREQTILGSDVTFNQRVYARKKVL